MEFKDTMKKRAQKVGRLWNQPCLVRFRTLGAGKPVAKTHPTLVFEDMGASSKLMNLRESAWKTQPKDHEDRMAGKGFNAFFSFTNNFVHKFIPVRQAMKSACESSCGQRLGKARKVASVANDESKEQKRGLFWKRTKSKEQSFFFFATLMDFCHLKKSELEPKFPKYNGRVVLRCSTEKNDSGSYDVFTEQGSSASQMTASKVMGVTARPPGMRRTSSRCKFRLYSIHHGGHSSIAETSQVRLSR